MLCYNLETCVARAKQLVWRDLRVLLIIDLLHMGNIYVLMNVVWTLTWSLAGLGCISSHRSPFFLCGLFSSGLFFSVIHYRVYSFLLSLTLEHA